MAKNQKKAKLNEEVNTLFNCPNKCDFKESCKYQKEKIINDFQTKFCSEHLVVLSYKKIK